MRGIADHDMISHTRRQDIPEAYLSRASMDRHSYRGVRVWGAPSRQVSTSVEYERCNRLISRVVTCIREELDVYSVCPLQVA